MNVVPCPPPVPANLPTGLTAGSCLTVKLLVSRNLKNALKTATVLDPQDIVRSLILASGYEQSMPTVYLSSFRYVEPFVQEGPQCGLVALAMAIDILLGTRLSDDHIFNVAREAGFTKQGEMFSATDMLSLAQQLAPCTGCILSTPSHLEMSAVVRALLSSQVVLVPYDRDLNNEPCCRRGTRAHWAVLTGVLVPALDSPVSHSPLQSVPDSQIVNLHHISLDSGVDWPQIEGAIAAGYPIYVYAAQGRSIRTHMWRLDDLLASNAQLVEPDPQIAASPNEYVIGVGLEHTLAGRVVVLSKAALKSVDLPVC